MPSTRMSPSDGAISAPIMLRMVDFPRPEGPTIATNSLSPTSKETWDTAATSRGPPANVLETSRIEMRIRPTGGLRREERDRDPRSPLSSLRALHVASGLELRARPGDERHVDGPRIRDGRVDRDRNPHLHAVLVVLFVDRKVPVEDGLVVANGVQDLLAAVGRHVRLLEQVNDLFVLGPVHPLLSAIAGAHVALDQFGRLLDRLLENVSHRHRDRPAEDAIPRLRVLDVVDGLTKTLRHRFGLPL